MPYRLPPRERGDVVAAAVYVLIAEGGTDAVTMRAIAGKVGVSVGTLANHFRYKAHLWQVVTYGIGRDLSRELDRRTRLQGLAGLLPETSDQIEEVGVWLALVSLARVSEPVRNGVEGVSAEQRELLRLCLQQAHEPPRRVLATDPVVGRVWTLLQGLWMELSRPDPVLTPDEASDFLRATAGTEAGTSAAAGAAS